MSAGSGGGGESPESGRKDVKISILAQLQSFRRDKTHVPGNKRKLQLQRAAPQPTPTQSSCSSEAFPNVSGGADAKSATKVESTHHGEERYTEETANQKTSVSNQSEITEIVGFEISEEAHHGEEEEERVAIEKISNVIRPIDRGVVHQICSGQVIVTLSTAVKELVENSLDAGASKIDIRLVEHGSKLVEVSDNGSGIDEGNFEGLALKHHTSKITEFEDLGSLTTFGFRGEALSSLCALSHLTVTTRHKHSEQKIAHRIEYGNSGHITAKTRCPRECGTTISMRDLFHTLPVRHREFLKNLKREYHRMVNILYGYCLVVNSVRITCTNQVGNGGATKVLSVPPSDSMKDRIVAVFGSKQYTSLVEIKPPEEVPEEILAEYGLNEQSYSRKYEIEGYISQPNCGRSSNDRQFYFINSRPCDPAKISRVINEIYHSFSRHQNPFVCLHIKTNRENVDINVTPDKRTLYVQNEKILLATLKAALVPLLASAASSFSSANSLSQSQLTFSGFSQTNNESEEDSTLCTSNTFEIDGADVTLVNETGSQEFDRQYSTAGPSNLPRSVINKTNAFIERLNRGRSESASSSVRNQSDTASFKRPRNFESSGSAAVSKQPKVSGFMKKYGVTEKDNFGGRSSKAMGIDIDESMDIDSDPNENVDDGNEAAFESQSTSKDFYKETEDDDTDDEEVIAYDDDDDAYENSQKEANSVSVKVNWKEVADFNSQQHDDASSTVNFASRFRAKINPEDNKTAEEELKKQLSKDMFSKMQIHGQFNLGFIIVRNGPDLFIVDQHASDEKFNYEDLEKTTVLQRQTLIRPLDLELPAISENIIIDNVKAFQRNGFDFIISPDAEPTKRVKLSKIPYSKNTEFDKSDLEELVFMMEDASEDSFYRPTKVRQMFASRACRKSVMIGTALGSKEMRTIVNHMGEMEQPWNCPHGRPTIRHLINLNLLPDLDNIKFNH